MRYYQSIIGMVQNITAQKLTMVIIVLLNLSPLLYANMGPTIELPWEDPLSRLSSSLTGPVAYYVSLIGVFAAGIGLLFGGELNEFARKGILLGLVISVVIFASSILQTLFSYGGLMVC